MAEPRVAQSIHRAFTIACKHVRPPLDHQPSDHVGQQVLLHFPSGFVQSVPELLDVVGSDLSHHAGHQHLEGPQARVGPDAHQVAMQPGVVLADELHDFGGLSDGTREPVDNYASPVPHHQAEAEERLDVVVVGHQQRRQDVRHA
eukprot:scaffold49636_cov28-Prasinocladus_malaysianus.AAC.1